MCRRCIFTIDQKDRRWLAIRTFSGPGMSPNDFHREMQKLCRHDKKRIDWIRRTTNNPQLIKTQLAAGLKNGKIANLLPHAELLLVYGECFDKRPDTSKGWCASDFSYNNCYGEAYLRACRSEHLSYVEGLCLPVVTTRGFLCHAWNIDQEGQVHDTTWPMSHWNQYFGITFDLDWVKENCKMECGIFYPDNWKYNEVPVREYLNIRWIEDVRITI